LTQGFRAPSSVPHSRLIATAAASDMEILNIFVNDMSRPV